MYELVAPEIGGVEDSDGNLIEADEKVDDGPSVGYDAVVLLPSEPRAQRLALDATSRDFVPDAFAHAKYIGYVADAMPLLEKAGVAADLDEGCLPLDEAGSATRFVETCRTLRFWPREAEVDQT